jgi:O-antigen ligase
VTPAVTAVVAVVVVVVIAVVVAPVVALVAVVAMTPVTAVVTGESKWADRQQASGAHREDDCSLLKHGISP